MAMEKRFVLVVAVFLGLQSLVAATSGTATYYTVYTPSACYGNEDKGTMIAAASDPIYDNGAACGRQYSVTCTGPTNEGVPHPCTGASVTVTIVDRCPSPGCQATLDLSEQAFAAIADLNAGKINIEYTLV
ncbi:putative EG45-like domain containing protein 1 [Phoenix dactylifera]|uniref:EG45-like domain containing protein 1 n=1 Tax=Phoenix dactylifera TaxID=42345 RepID=A0A8B8J134_PHODC|nr:putative EG45-like domain containing protein 1 [Phoenix dactylifera]